MSSEKISESLLRKLKIANQLKTDERKQFEKEYTPFLLIVDTNNFKEVKVNGENLYKKELKIDSIAKINNKLSTEDYYNEFNSVALGMSLRVRFNNNRGLNFISIWIPDVISVEFEKSPESFLDIIEKYSFDLPY